MHLAAARAFGPLEGLFEISWNDRRYDSDINTFAPTTLDAYTLARLALSWRASDRLRLTLRAENLFDADYEQVDGYNTAGRSVFAGVQVRM
jgi:vitamin B12 transporter